jgi:transcriptional regulator with XRE-family HTH domain
MIPADLNLKAMREGARLTQTDLAKRLGVTQTQVLRYEAEPENVPVRILREWAAACGEVAAARGLDAGAPYAALGERIAQLGIFAQGQPPLEEGDTVNASLGIEDLRAVLRELGRKPRVLLAGRYDAGKSRLANTLLGADRLPTAYRPTTRIVCLIRHVSEKPAWQAEDVWVMRDGFDMARHEDEAHCREFRLLAGDFETLARAGAHPREGEKAKPSHDGDGPAAALVYVDAPILLACDILDTPGFGHDERDTALTRAVFSRGDILVYLSPLAGFMNGEDMHSLGTLIEALPAGKEVSPLRRLAVLATHVHHNVKEVDFIEALEAGSARIAQELAPHLRSLAGESEVDASQIRPRLFPWYVDIPARREPFEHDLRELLAELRPGVIHREADEAAARFRSDVAHEYGREADYLRALLKDHEEAAEEVAALLAARPEHHARMTNKRRAVEERIARAKASTRSFLSGSVAPLLAADRIQAFIEERYPDSKEAEQHAANAVIAAARGEVERHVEAEARALSAEIEDFLSGYSKPAIGTKEIALAIPFDAQSVFLGTLATGGAYGALAFWASVVAGGSNLGAYILVAKATGLLASLGISFAGGGAGATALVAALGGPVTIGVAIALTVGLMVYQVFGRSWQARLAEKIAGHLKGEEVLEEFGAQLDCLWDETLSAFMRAADETEAAFDGHIRRLMDRLETPREVLEVRLARVEARRAFLSFVPWTPLSRGCPR